MPSCPLTFLWCAQNGVSNERAALRLHPNVQSVCVHLPGVHLEPGVVVKEAIPVPGLLDIGRYPTGDDDESHAIAADRRAAGLDSQVDPDVMPRKYRKLLVNTVNALDALCGPQARSSAFAARARAEGRAVLAAAGIDVAGDDAAQLQRECSVAPQAVAGLPAAGSSSWRSLARRTGARKPTGSTVRSRCSAGCIGCRRRSTSFCNASHARPLRAIGAGSSGRAGTGAADEPVLETVGVVNDAGRDRVPVEPGGVLPHELANLSAGQLADRAGNDLLSAGPKRIAVWVVLLEQYVLDTDPVAQHEAARILDRAEIEVAA